MLTIALFGPQSLRVIQSGAALFIAAKEVPRFLGTLKLFPFGEMNRPIERGPQLAVLFR